ncbi:uncharacterized protein LOC119725184 [Patiria miniata]|uniref:F5/8 type C domain-containing protein n=1 Tax=Patiria miniata TaxID=46514 RepID=A0A913ZKZ6_PATMI|nr:uncharacterized protein LOC119725184 [Patiria miniata]
MSQNYFIEKHPSVNCPDFFHPGGATDPAVTVSSLAGSSQYSSYSPSKGLISNPGFWKPSSNNNNQYLEVRFSESTYVSGITTKGCNSGCPQNGSPQYVESYKLQTNNDGSNSFQYYKNLKSGSDVVFDGNTNGNGIVRNNFDVPILVRKLRIRPITWNRGIALAVELYGYTPGSASDLCSGSGQSVAEAGGPGTVYIQQGTNGAIGGHLQVNNMGKIPNAKTNSDCDQFFFEDSGAAAWISSAHDLNSISLSNGGHLVVASNIDFTQATGDVTTMMHLISTTTCELGSRLEVESHVNGDAILTLPGVGITMTKSVTVRGTLNTDPNTELTFGGYSGATLTLIPRLSSMQTLQLRSLTIKTNAKLDLQESSTAGNCGYTLDVSVSDRSLTMEHPSELTVACPVTIDVTSLLLDAASFNTKSVTGTSSIRTPALTVTGSVTTGKMDLLDCSNLDVRSTGQMTLTLGDPKELRVPTIEVDGTLTSTTPVAVYCHALTVSQGGSFSWPGSSGSVLESNMTFIDGYFRPGSLVGLTSGLPQFTVGANGNVSIITEDSFGTDSFEVRGQMVVSSQPVVFRGVMNQLVNSFTIASGGQLSLNTTGSGQSEIHAEYVTVDGALQTGLLNIGSGWNDLTVGSSGSFTFDPDGNFAINTIHISGVVESLKHLIINGRSQSATTIFETTAGSSVTFDLGRFHNVSGELNHTQLRVQDIVVGGYFQAHELSFPYEFNQLRVDQTGELHMNSVGPLMVHTFKVNGTMRTTNPLIVTGTTYDRARSLVIGVAGEVFLDEDGRSSGEWTNVSYFGFHGVTISGSLHAGLFSNIYPTTFGWDTLYLDGDAEFRFEPADDFACDSVVFYGGPTMEAFTPVIMRGSTDRLIQQLTISYPGSLLFDTSEGDKNQWRSVGSEVHAEIVTVDGTFHAGLIDFGVGWKTLNVGGQGLFTLQSTDFPVNNITVQNPSGRMEVLTPLNIHGREQTHVYDLTIEAGATLSLDTGSYAGTDYTNSSYSTVLIDVVTIDGSFLASKLSISAYQITVGGMFTFYASTPEEFDFLTVSSAGQVQITNPVTILGRSSNLTDSIDIAGRVKLHAAISDHNNHVWSSLNSSVFHLDHLSVNGTLEAGILSVGTGWQTFSVGDQGVVTFQPEGTYRIDDITIAGHVTSFTAMPATAPLISDSLRVYSTAVFDIDFRGPAGSTEEGATNSTLLIGTVQITDGTLQAGSLWIEANEITIGNGGVLTVEGGGHLSDQGPGAGVAYASGASGASHGGRGGRGGHTSQRTIAENLPYGNIYEKGYWGSGGGSGGGLGGRGGGRVVALVTGTFVVDGTIRLDADNAVGSHASGGSGGALWVESNEFRGTGYIYSNGGAGSGFGGGGAGGRVSINYDHGDFKSGHIFVKGKFTCSLHL